MSANPIEIKGNINPVIQGDKASAAGGGPGPNVNTVSNLDVNDSKISFEYDDLVWVLDDDNINDRTWFPGQITEKKADNLYDIRFNQDPHPGVPIDQITKFELKVGDDVIVFRLFLDIRQNVDDAAPILKGGVRWFHCLQNPILVLERKHLPGALVRQDRRADLPEVVAARAHAGRLPGTLHRRQQQADERSNDRDHHEQFDEREGGPIVPRSDWACREGKHDGLRFK